MTVEEIKGKIPSLADDQAAAVLDLASAMAASAKNDLTRELYTNLEKDVLETTGKTKPDGQKTYAFFREVLSEGKSAGSKAEKARSEYEDLKAKYDALAAKSDAGDASSERTKQLEQELDKAKKKAEKLELDLTTKSQEWEAKYAEQESAREQERFSNVVSTSTSGLKFKDGLSDYVIDLAKGDVTKKVNQYERSWTEDGRLEFKDKDGMVLRDNETSRPLTVKDLYERELSQSGLLAENEQKSGAGSGTKGSTTTGSNSSVFSVDGLPDQVSANRALEDHLVAKGLSIGSFEFQREFDATYTETIAPLDLPVRA